MLLLLILLLIDVAHICLLHSVLLQAVIAFILIYYIFDLFAIVALHPDFIGSWKYFQSVCPPQRSFSAFIQHLQKIWSRCSIPRYRINFLLGYSILINHAECLHSLHTPRSLYKLYAVTVIIYSTVHRSLITVLSNRHWPACELYIYMSVVIIAAQTGYSTNHAEKLNSLPCLWPFPFAIAGLCV